MSLLAAIARHADGPAPVVRVAAEAMATRFEIALHGARPEALRAAAEEALNEVARVERWLSPYLPASCLARIHREAHRRPVAVEPPVFQFLCLVQDLVQATGGAFDPTVGPLLRAWGFHGGDPVAPDPAAIDRAYSLVGWRHVQLDPSARSVWLARPGVEIHPGAIGKGWALDRAAEILRECGVDSALLHGGTSTVVAMGTPPGLPAWRVALPGAPDSSMHDAVVDLRDETLSVSAAWGRSIHGPAHVIDPRTGQPVAAGRLAAVALPSAAASDAWSTALLVDSHGIPQRLDSRHPGARWWNSARV
ncbi:MAG: FAD:protein FMN transferase [Verrucomicrobiota bacterium]|jgi:thiamine biosynthesis lipoprotein